MARSLDGPGVRDHELPDPARVISTWSNAGTTIVSPEEVASASTRSSPPR
jgi:hypothetical protein